MTLSRRGAVIALVAGVVATIALALGLGSAASAEDVATSIAVGVAIVFALAKLSDRVWERTTLPDRRVGAAAAVVWFGVLAVGYTQTDLGTALSVGILAGFLIGLVSGLLLAGDPRTAFYHGLLVGAVVGLCATLLVLPARSGDASSFIGATLVAMFAFPLLFGLFCGGGSALGGWVRYWRRPRPAGHN